MQVTSQELATILAALRFFQANFDDKEQMVEEMEYHFQDCEPLMYDEIDELCEKINRQPFGYVVVNLSKLAPSWNDGACYYVMPGEEPHTYSKLSSAAEQVADRIHEDNHTLDSMSIFALHEVSREEAEPLVAEALKQLEE
jgi:hypothetical protein